MFLRSPKSRLRNKLNRRSQSRIRHESLEDRVLLAYSDFIVADNPIVYYQFDDASAANSATVADTANVAAGDNSATYNGTMAFDSAAPAGISGQAIRFSGTDDSITSDAPVTVGASGEYSVELWFKSDASAQQDLFAATSSGHAILLELQSNGQIRFLHRSPSGSSGGQNIYSPNNSYTPGKWHHLVAVNTGSQMQLFLDGSQVGTATPSNDVNFPTDFLIGRLALSSSARVFNGSLDEIAVYDSALTPAQVSDHFGAAFGARDDSYTGASDDSVFSVPAGPQDLLFNDTGIPNTVVIADPTSAEGAAISVNADGSFSYDPSTSVSVQALDGGDSLIDTFTYSVTDGGIPTGRFVRIENNGDATRRMDIGEIEVFAAGVVPGAIGSNQAIDLAFSGNGASVYAKGAASGFSQPHGGTDDPNLIDGAETSGAATWSSNGVGNFVVIDLGASFDIETVRVHQRNDSCCQDRLMDFTVSVLEDNGGVPGAVVSRNVEPGQPATNGFAELIMGRTDTATVSIQVDGTNSPPNAVDDGTFFTTEDVVYNGPVYNVALASNGGVASQSTTGAGGVPSRGIDGNTSGVWGNGSVTHTANSAFNWWQVELDSMSSIEEITLWNRTDCCSARLQEFRVSVFAGDPDSGGTEVFSVDYPAMAPPNPITFNAGGAVGNFVRVAIDPDGDGLNSQGGIVSLAEVQVFGTPLGGLLANDYDPEGSPLTIISYDNPSVNGASVTVNADGTFSYDPTGTPYFQSLDEGQTVSDTFTYTISDGSTNVIPGPAMFDFGAGNLLGWNVLNGAAHFRTGDGDGMTPANSTGGFAHDGAHETFLVASPDFMLNGSVLDANNNVLSVEFAGGAGDQNNQGQIYNTPGDVTAANGGNSFSTGQKGLAFYNTATGNYDATIFENNNGGTDTRNFTAADLTGLGVNPSATYKLHYFENDEGSWGWGQLNMVNIAGDLIVPASPATATVTMQVTGINDAPVANNDSASITEAVDGIPASNTIGGNVLSNDTDVDDPNSSFTVTTAGTTAGTYGSLALNANGSYTYTLDDSNPAVQALLDSQTLTDSFPYTMSDNHSGGNAMTSGATLTVTILGGNDSPVATDNSAAVTEDTALTDSGNLITDDDGAGADSDVDHAQASLGIVQVGAATDPATDAIGNYGSVDWESDGSYTYSLDNANTDVQALAVGETLTDTFMYTVSEPGLNEDGLFAISLLAADGGGGSNDNDLNSTTETLGIWDAIDGGTPVPGLVTAGNNYNIGRFEAGTAGQVLYNGNRDGYTGSAGYNTVGGGSITGGDDFSLRAQAFLRFTAAGEYSIAAGSDDGRRIELTEAFAGSAPGYSGFTAQGGQVTGSVTPTVVFFDGTTGHQYTTGVFSVAAGDVLALDSFFFERGGGDSFNIAIKAGNDTDHGGTGDGWALLSDGTLGIELSSQYENQTDNADLTVTINGTNDVPTATNAGNVTVDEGTTATNSGTFNDIDASDNVTITASIGTIVSQDTGNSGNWSWEWPTNDGPMQSQTVTITATDLQGATSTTTFDLTVNNVAPQLQNVAVTDADETQTVTLTGDIVGETSPVDTFVLNVDWGDPNSPGSEQFTFPAGTTDFTVTHTYTDDDPAGTSSDMYDIRVSLTDDDANGIAVNFSNAFGGSAQGSSNVTMPTGAYIANTWNNVVSPVSNTGDGSQIDLTDAHGNSSATDIAWTSNNTWSTGSWANDGGIGSLFRAYLDTGNGGFANGTNINFSDIGYAGYDVYVYFDGGATGRFGNYEVNDGMVEVQVGNDNADGAGSYILDNGTSATSGNYLRFVGFTGNSPTIRSGATSGFRAPVNAVQIVEASVVTVTTTITNVAPVGADDSGSTDENTPLVVAAPGLLGNDTDVSPQDQPILTVSEINGSGSLTGTSQYGAQVTLNADGSYTYDPSNAAALQALSTGESIVDSFTYTVIDDDLGSDTATVTITVTGDAVIEIDTSFDHVFLPAAAPPGVTAPIVPSAEAGADQVTLTVNGSALDITVNGSLVRSTTAISSGTPISVVAGAADTLSIDDSADATGDGAASVDFDSIDGVIDGGSVVSHSGVGAITIDAGTDADSFTLNNLAGGALSSVTVNGGAGDDTFITTPQSVAVNVNANSPVLPADPGDTLNLDLTAEPVPLVLPTSSDGAFTSANVANAPISWTSVETFIINGEVVPTNRLFVEATTGSDRVIFYSTNDGFQVRINNLIFPADGTSFDSTAIEAIEAVGREGSDQLIVAGNLRIPAELDGGEGNDYLASTDADDILIGGLGNDILLAGDGNNTIDGGEGNDRLEGRDGIDVIFGGDGNDRLNGGGGDDILDGGADNDFLFGGLGNDLLVGRSGIDTLNGYTGNDVILGGEHADQLFGNQGNDILFGGLGADRVRGDHDNDDVIGGRSTNGLTFFDDDVENALDAIIADYSLTLADVNSAVANAVTNWQAAGTDRSGFGTVVADDSYDDLTGGTGTDEFHSADDRIRDLRASEGDSMIP